LDECVTVKENGKTRKITKREAMFKQVVNKAASGDLKSLQFIAGIIKATDGPRSEEGTASAGWSTELSQREKNQWQSTLKGLFASGLTPEDLGIAMSTSGRVSDVTDQSAPVKCSPSGDKK
jgi:hypothetical protein